MEMASKFVVQRTKNCGVFAWGVCSLQTPTSWIYSKGNIHKFWRGKWLCVQRV